MREGGWKVEKVTCKHAGFGTTAKSERSLWIGRWIDTSGALG